MIVIQFKTMTKAKAQDMGNRWHVWVEIYLLGLKMQTRDGQKRRLIFRKITLVDSRHGGSEATSHYLSQIKQKED